MKFVFLTSTKIIFYSDFGEHTMAILESRHKKYLTYYDSCTTI